MMHINAYHCSLQKGLAFCQAAGIASKDRSRSLKSFGCHLETSPGPVQVPVAQPQASS